MLAKGYQANPDTGRQLLFKDYMATAKSHYEKVNGGEGCLAINGYDSEGAPLIFSLKYIFVNNRWLIDDIHIVFIERIDDFAGSAICPGEYKAA